MPEILQNILAFNSDSPLLFTQFYFWGFFAIVYAMFSLLGNKPLLRNSFLCFVSLFFYYKASGLFVLLLLFVVLSSYCMGAIIHRCQTSWLRKTMLIISVVIDLLLLSYFKYAYFFADVIQNITGYEIQLTNAFSEMANALAHNNYFNVDSIVLPVGISFFTFQVISYSVDIYRREIKPIRNLLDFAFYVSFFPQLVAGPIVRAKDFIPQLHKAFHLSKRQFGIAVFWILNGLAKKIILSDYIAVHFIDRVFDNPLLFSGFENTVALFGYSLQVYADFSGYTDIAIGVAMLMGFYLPKNFNSPYKATNAGDFWRRWHMSLSSWLRDYLYIPLGGNRKASFGTYFWIGLVSAIVLILSGSIYAMLSVLALTLIITMVALISPQSRHKIITNLNVLVTMLLGGLWHGASWNFVLWGALNGAGLILSKFWKKMNWHWRTLSIIVLTASITTLSITHTRAIYNILTVWILCICAITIVRYCYHLCKPKSELPYLSAIWGIIQTFTFITFTRLFFRTGSNLDPDIANETAWNTAVNMIRQIGTPWNIDIIGSVITEYITTFLIIAIGMAIHWMPTDFKRWYRINFAQLPTAVIAVIVVLIVFGLYQFVSADMQAFIYFQF